MKVALITVCAIAVVVIGIEIISRIVYRRWRRRFDSLPPDEQRKEQERLYKAQQMRT